MAWARRLGTAHRWVVLILATAVWARCFGEARLEEFGWQFRLIEVWAASATALSAAFTVRLSMGWSRSPHAPFVAATAALNAVVLVLHLGPSGAFAPTSPGWHAASLLLVLPLMQIADALLILGAFRRVRGAVAWVSAGALTYVAWVELAVRPLNATPEGLGGLPYPSLDAMAPIDRLTVYAVVTGLALAVLSGFSVLQRRLRPEGAGAGGGGIAA